MSESAEDRTAKWLVGDRLACVLHLGDGSLAYRLAEQGHEVVIVGDDAITRRHPDIQYVRTQGERLPFRSRAFDAVIVPEVRDAPLALAEYARVLRTDGLVSTVSHRHDGSIPWLRKLRELIGARDDAAPRTDTFTASGLFHEPEVIDSGSWERLDLPALMRFAAERRSPSVSEAVMSQVRQLFESYGAQTGTLQLRTESTCLRARVDKSSMAQVEETSEIMLLDFR